MPTDHADASSGRSGRAGEPRDRVLTVGTDMLAVGGRDGGQDVGVDARPIVAGEGASVLGQRTQSRTNGL